VRIACVSQDRGIAPGRKKGAAVHLAALRDSFRELGADVVALDEHDGQLLRDSLEQTHAQRPFQFVYERYALGCDVGSRFCSAQRLPHVLELNAPLALEEALYRERSTPVDILRREVEVFRCAASILCVSRQVAQYALERGARPASVRVQPNAVDTRVFHPREPHDPLRGALVPGQRVALGFHGRLRDWHGLELVARAGRALLQSGDDVHFVLAGEGDFERAFEPHVARDRITRLPWQAHAEVARTVACFDVLVLGSLAQQPYYYSPLKLCEAMAAHVVPVVPRAGDLPEIVRDGENGLCYAPGDEQDLAQSLRRLVRDPALRARLARAAGACASRVTWNDVARDILDRVRERVTTP
jgi:glycosyltransferase involved in cell wall biosynthesis